MDTKVYGPDDSPFQDVMQRSSIENIQRRVAALERRTDVRHTAMMELVIAGIAHKARSGQLPELEKDQSLYAALIELAEKIGPTP